MFQWHEAALARVLEIKARLPHALLITGRPGTGLFEFAGALASSLLCERPKPDGRFCGECLACGWFVQRNHPDYRLVQPESYEPDTEGEAPKEKKKSEQIRIEQVRELGELLAVGTHRAGRRVVMLHPADTMNPPTQNALLKSLEEPPPATVFLLVSAAPHRLLPTVRSRCQAIALRVPSREASVAWLQAAGVKAPEQLLAWAGGAPLLAHEMSGRSELLGQLAERLSDPRMEPLTLAAACAAADPAEFIATLYRWVYDLLSVRVAGRARYHPGREAALAEVAGRARPERIAAFLRTLAEARSLAEHTLNPRLLFEDLLLGYRDAVAAPRSTPAAHAR